MGGESGGWEHGVGQGGGSMGVGMGDWDVVIL